jgi:excisionase family DNA binding protein
MRELERYTTAEAAERLRIKPESVARKLERGQLAAIKVGTHWLIPKDILDALLQPPAPHG